MKACMTQIENKTQLRINCHLVDLICDANSNVRQTCSIGVSEQLKLDFAPELHKIKANSKMKDKAEIMVCQCSSTEHQVVYYHNQSDNEVYMHVHLSSGPWWKRVWPALKYLFGHRSRYGNWDEFILGPEHVDQLRKLADRIEGCEHERLRRHAEQW